MACSSCGKARKALKNMISNSNSQKTQKQIVIENRARRSEERAARIARRNERMKKRNDMLNAINKK